MCLRCAPTLTPSTQFDLDRPETPSSQFPEQENTMHDTYVIPSSDVSRRLWRHVGLMILDGRRWEAAESSHSVCVLQRT